MKTAYYSAKLDRSNDLIRHPSDDVRWLDVKRDFALIQNHYKLFGVDNIKESDFDEKEWRLCAVIKNGEIISFAGVIYMTDHNWEIGAVSTHPHHRKKGYAKIVCSFAAKYILDQGKRATCNTSAENHAMIKVMLDIGMTENNKMTANSTNR